MLSFKSFIIEAIQLIKEAAEAVTPQNARGVLHELLTVRAHVQHHGAVMHNFDDGRETVDQAHDRIAKKLFGPKYESHPEYKDMKAKAEGAANAGLQAFKENGGSFKKGKTRVAWTSKTGDVEKVTGKKTHQRDDASDYYLFNNGKDATGASLKTVQEKNGHAPTSNGGRGDVDRMLGISTDHHVQNARSAVVKKHPELKGATAKKAKEIIKSNPEVKKTEMEQRSVALKNIANDYATAFTRMHPKARAQFLRTSMRANPTGANHIRITSGGTGGDFSHNVERPVEQHDHLLNDAENIHVRVHGGNSVKFVHVHPKTGVETPIHQIRLKSAGSEGIFGSQKTSGENLKAPKAKAETRVIGQNIPDPKNPGKPMGAKAPAKRK